MTRIPPKNTKNRIKESHKESSLRSAHTIKVCRKRERANIKGWLSRIITREREAISEMIMSRGSLPKTLTLEVRDGVTSPLED